MLITIILIQLNNNKLHGNPKSEASVVHNWNKSLPKIYICFLFHLIYLQLGIYTSAHKNIITFTDTSSDSSFSYYYYPRRTYIHYMTETWFNLLPRSHIQMYFLYTLKPLLAIIYLKE